MVLCVLTRDAPCADSSRIQPEESLSLNIKCMGSISPTCTQWGYPCTSFTMCVVTFVTQVVLFAGEHVYTILCTFWSRGRFFPCKLSQCLIWHNFLPAFLRLAFAFCLNSSVLWVITRPKVVSNWCFRSTHRSRLQGSSCRLAQLQPWRWDGRVHSKRRFHTTLRRLITQKKEEFSSTTAENISCACSLRVRDGTQCSEPFFTYF